ncbi:hypothetical protein C8A00DRAFT_37924 [Chaetomidium leptoderma]|uniref:Uncharacterized protein n=1 Tax=Chaetomidium leptoderma TaxID=669021 RepID=A0AAN6VDI4_9PEZI|nr:hypothetical protein C8A00DRAFT_37924 [Chaetomidium leptoderma]
MDIAFKISPTVLYGIGIDFSTDSTVDVIGGATFSWTDAAAPINIMSRSLVSQRNWQPSVSLTTPSFKTGATVSIKPYMRWLIKLSVDIYGMVKISPSITSGCPANSLKVNTYLNTANTVSFGDGTGAALYSGQAGSTNQCFTVPGLLPSAEEVQSLKAVGGAYCTSYIKYVSPVTVVYSTSTSTVPSTTTSFSTIDVYSTTTVSAVITTVTAAGKTPNFAYLNWKRDIAESTATPAPTPTAAPAGSLEKRQAVAQPSMLAGWDATKISFACKQVATGTSTMSYTTTTTVTSGVVTATAVLTVNKNGPLVTETYMQTMGRFMGATTETVEGTATKTVCPTPQATSCFKLQPDVADYEYDTFYLSANGRLMGYTAEGTTFFLGKSFPWVWNGYYGEVYFMDASSGGAGAEVATCWKDTDPCSKGFQCKATSPAEILGMSIQEPVYEYYDEWSFDFSGWSSNSFRPAWGLVTDGLPYYVWVPITFTYEDVPCPCY